MGNIPLGGLQEGKGMRVGKFDGRQIRRGRHGLERVHRLTDVGDVQRADVGEAPPTLMTGTSLYPGIGKWCCMISETRSILGSWANGV